METTEIVSLISSVGFPIVVAWYLLTTLKKTIEENTKVIQELKEALTKLCERINNVPN